MPTAGQHDSRRLTLPKLAPTDPLPGLRGDLKVTADLTSDDAVVQVQDTRSGKVHNLKEVEFSLARMFNGKRTAEQVVQAATALGMPVTLESLTGFLGKLKGLGLIDEAAPPPAPEPPAKKVGLDTISTWPMRDEWGEGLRGLFQTALKAYRQESFDEALQAIEAFLRENPHSKEAGELKARIEKKRLAWSGSAAPKSFSKAFSELEDSWFEEGESGDWAKDLPPEPGSQVSAAPKSSKAPLFIVGGLAALGALALLVPLPYKVEAKASLRAFGAATNVNAPHNGTVASVEVKDGQWVEKGAVLLRYDGAAAKARLDKATADLNAKDARLKKAKLPNPKVAKAKAAMQKADAAETKAKNELSDANGAAKFKKTPAVAKADKKLAAATKVALAARKAFVAAGGGDDAGQLQLEVDAAKKLVDAATADQGAPELVAPVSGQVTGITAKPGATLPKDGAVLRLEDPSTLAADLEVSAKDRAALLPGQDVTLHVGGKTFSARLVQVGAQGVVATMDNAKRELQPGATGNATVKGGNRSVLSRL